MQEAGNQEDEGLAGVAGAPALEAGEWLKGLCPLRPHLLPQKGEQVESLKTTELCRLNPTIATPRRGPKGR